MTHDQLLMNRRDFLKAAAISSAALAFASSPLRAADAPSSNPAQLPRRPYGKTAVQLSIIGFPGLALRGMQQDHVNRLIAQAYERGVNYYDVAPEYGDSEILLGPALEPYRKNVFLACKTGRRDADSARQELKRSFQRLRTDHFDLYQLHHISDPKKDVDAAFAPGGVMEVLIEAKKSGQVRFLGFTAHSIEAALAAMQRFDFDSVLFPLNFANVYKGNFGRQILDMAQSKGAARLAIKALCRQRWPANDPNRRKFPRCWYQPLTDPREADLGLRFTLSQPVTAAVPPADESLFWLAMDLAMKFRPITEQEDQELKTLADKMDPLFQAPRA